jgi:GT2 family glycosyltransferase
VSRPAVSVVMPFAGSRTEARAALAVLRELGDEGGAEGEDELILADNSGTAPDGGRIRVVRAGGERSPSHARNVGAEHATHDWILFLDADTSPQPRLLERYFAESIDDDVGALAGEVRAGEAISFAARYGAARSFLGQQAHIAHPYLPRAVAANLLVRRQAFERVGGFYEGVRAAEDTDFSWRLQRAGWRLEARPQACVEHQYRTTLGALRRQWRGYAAGRAWLGRRYQDFEPQPAVRRAASRVFCRRAGRRRAAAGRFPAPPATSSEPPPRAAPGRLERGGFLAVDALLGIDELAGFALSNRPAPGDRPPVQTVLITGRFPAPGDPLVDFARTLAQVRVEAAARPEVVDQRAARELGVVYREDDGPAARATALARLLVRHPVRCVLDLVHRRPGDPGLAALAPAVLRLGGDPKARVHALGGADASGTARRLAALAGRPLEPGRV